MIDIEPALARILLTFAAYTMRHEHPKSFAEWADNEVIAIVVESTSHLTDKQLEIC